MSCKLSAESPSSAPASPCSVVSFRTEFRRWCRGNKNITPFENEQLPSTWWQLYNLEGILKKQYILIFSQREHLLRSSRVDFHEIRHEQVNLPPIYYIEYTIPANSKSHQGIGENLKKIFQEIAKKKEHAHKMRSLLGKLSALGQTRLIINGYCPRFWLLCGILWSSGAAFLGFMCRFLGQMGQANMLFPLLQLFESRICPGDVPWKGGLQA